MHLVEEQMLNEALRAVREQGTRIAALEQRIAHLERDPNAAAHVQTPMRGVERGDAPASSTPEGVSGARDAVHVERMRRYELEAELYEKYGLHQKADTRRAEAEHERRLIGRAHVMRACDHLRNLASPNLDACHWLLLDAMAHLHEFLGERGRAIEVYEVLLRRDRGEDVVRQNAAYYRAKLTELREQKGGAGSPSIFEIVARLAESGETGDALRLADELCENHMFLPEYAAPLATLILAHPHLQRHFPNALQFCIEHGQADALLEHVIACVAVQDAFSCQPIILEECIEAIGDVPGVRERAVAALRKSRAPPSTTDTIYAIFDRMLQGIMAQ